jgi:hypothetical protein
MATILKEVRQGANSYRCEPRLAPDWIVRNLQTHREYLGLFALADQDGRILAKLPGRVFEWIGLPTEVYIYDPPIQLRQHHHGRCLQLLTPGSKWFKLHWEKPARTFDQARAYMEQLMEESFGTAVI